MDSITMGKDQQMQLHPQMLSHPTFMDTTHTIMDTTMDTTTTRGPLMLNQATFMDTIHMLMDTIMDTITMVKGQLTQHHPQMLNQVTFMDTTHTMDTITDTIMAKGLLNLPHHMDITLTMDTITDTIMVRGPLALNQVTFMDTTHTTETIMVIITVTINNKFIGCVP